MNRQEETFRFTASTIILLLVLASHIDDTYPAPRDREAKPSGMKNKLYEHPTSSEQERSRRRALGIIEEQSDRSELDVNHQPLQGNLPEMRPRPSLDTRKLKEATIKAASHAVQKFQNYEEHFTNPFPLRKSVPAKNLDILAERYHWKPVSEERDTSKRAKLSSNEERLVREAVRTFAQDLRRAPFEGGMTKYSPMQLRVK